MEEGGGGGLECLQRMRKEEGGNARVKRMVWR